MRYTTAAASAALLIVGCASPEATDPAPSSPGGGDPGSGSYDGEPFVPGSSDLSFVETSTGTRFNLLGQAYEGELADAHVQLGLLPGMTAFWFAWSVHHPGARVWSNGVNNPGEEILGSSECGVPCDEIRSACFGGADCIPSIDAPVWTTADDADNLGYLVPPDRIVGVVKNGRARAYPLDALWTHEIVNDTWDDWEFSLTYCPLTGSGIVLESEQEGGAMRFGVSGNLYNSNLVPYDRLTGSLYGQMRQVGIRGEQLGVALRTSAAIDTTWEAWLRMFPQTEVLADDVGVAGYPYGDYRDDHSDTFITTSPLPDDLYLNKSYAIGVILGGETVIYAFDEIEDQLGQLAIVEDEVGGVPVLVTFDARSQTAAMFSRTVEGVARDFEIE